MFYCHEEKIRFFILHGENAISSWKWYISSSLFCWRGGGSHYKVHIIFSSIWYTTWNPVLGGLWSSHNNYYKCSFQLSPHVALALEQAWPMFLCFKGHKRQTSLSLTHTHTYRACSHLDSSELVSSHLCVSTCLDWPLVIKWSWSRSFPCSIYK